MATATSKTKTDVAGRRVAKKGEARLARYMEKEVTPVIDLFADWLEKEVGIELDERERQILFIGSALRGDFQKSDVNQKRMAHRKQELEAEQEEREERRAAREAKRAERESAPKTKSALAAKVAGKTATKSAPASKTKSAPAKGGTTRRRPAAKSGDDF